VHKGFIGKKTNTTYSITRVGERAFKEHIEGLEKMIKGMKEYFFCLYTLKYKVLSINEMYMQLALRIYFIANAVVILTLAALLLGEGDLKFILLAIGAAIAWLSVIPNINSISKFFKSDYQ
jgi:hypothetical protein